MSKIDYELEAENRMNHYWKTGGVATGAVTMLDYFAGKALVAYWSSPDAINNNKTAATWCYDMAQAMLDKRREIFTPKETVTGVTGKTYG